MSHGISDANPPGASRHPSLAKEGNFHGFSFPRSSVGTPFEPLQRPATPERGRQIRMVIHQNNDDRALVRDIASGDQEMVSRPSGHNDRSSGIA